MKACKSQYDAILNSGEPAKVRNLWLHLLALYFPRELGFGLVSQDWPCNASTSLSISYISRCNTDTQDLCTQHKNMFVLTSESPLHGMSPETMNRYLSKFEEKIRAICTTGLDSKCICAAVAAGTHVHFFWLSPGEEYLQEEHSGVYDLAENENQIDYLLTRVRSDLIKSWKL